MKSKSMLAEEIGEITIWGSYRVAWQQSHWLKLVWKPYGQIGEAEVQKQLKAYTWLSLSCWFVTLALCVKMLKIKAVESSYSHSNQASLRALLAFFQLLGRSTMLKAKALISPLSCHSHIGIDKNITVSKAFQKIFKKFRNSIDRWYRLLSKFGILDLLICVFMFYVIVEKSPAPTRIWM